MILKFINLTEYNNYDKLKFISLIISKTFIVEWNQCTIYQKANICPCKVAHNYFINSIGERKNYNDK